MTFSLRAIAAIFGGRRRPLGQQGEDAAVRALKKAGYTILERNVHLGRYEIDIIAREGDTIAFVEVKTRRVVGDFQPEDNVTDRKQRHVIRAANIYISRKSDPTVYYRFDIAAGVMPETGKPSVTIYRDAFQAN